MADCDWCGVRFPDRSGGARWLMGNLALTTGALGESGSHHRVTRPPRPVWACEACAPLVRGRDVTGLVARAGEVAEAAGLDSALPAAEQALIFRAIQAALLTEITDGQRPSPEAREAFARDAAQVGANRMPEA